MNISGLAIKALFALSLTGTLHAAVSLTTEPTSGVVVRPGTRWVFSGDSTRTEMYWAGELVEIMVSNDKGYWWAHPNAGRVVTKTVPPELRFSYPQQCRRAFSMTTNPTRVGEELYLDLPCWRYEWVETNRSSPDHAPFAVDAPPKKMQMLILANSHFPLRMRSGWDGVWSTNSDVVELTLDGPIPSELFLPPKDLRLTKPFQVPRKRFEVVLRRTRSSPGSGGFTVEDTRISSDGNTITETHRITSHDGGGESTREPAERIIPFEQGALLLKVPLAAPIWNLVRKTGVDDILGYQADVLESKSPVLRCTYWVIDHPDFGTISARCVRESDYSPETNEVVRIEVAE